MELHVGAVSQRVVQVAAEMQIPAIVASQRQVNEDGGYIDMKPEELVDKVFAWSRGKTKVIRDHGGPTTRWDTDFVRRLEGDRAAGFDALHLDVSALRYGEAENEMLQHLLTRFDDTPVEVGGERDNHERLLWLARFAADRHSHVVGAIVPLGGHIWNDKQIGNLVTQSDAMSIISAFPAHVPTKAHNMDWARVHQYEEAGLSAYNIAPEIACIEVNLILSKLSRLDREELLNLGYNGAGWKNWYLESEGSLGQRSLTGVRYILETDKARRILDRYDIEDFVRGRIYEHLQSR